VEPAFDADERTMLTGFLDYHRATLLWKASGLTQEQMATSLPSSELTIAGLVKHLALVEDSWFTERFAGQGEGIWAGIDWDADRDWEMHSAVHDEPEQLLSLYRAACERSRQATASAELDQRSVVPDRTGEHFTLRWILLHLIEETARHNGHVDLLREAIDGVSGE
jgi:uncharacterized damage-inducible protein DinB